MRLIDADALRADAITRSGGTEFAFDNCYPFWQFSQAIAQAPTIEAVVLKFKIGDTAFFLNRYHRKVWPIMICSAEINSQGVSKYGCGGLCPDGYTPVHFPPSAIGETVFFTRAEAEAALAKMKGGANNV